ncbi:hypothetical protein AB0H86_17220 [Streptomyces sp. NPDC050997]|uniref:hypothetical protein n=1 Tax=Streptomyces sp. NPDC050997 TaxID=3155519 RepID=UPI00341B5117
MALPPLTRREYGPAALSSADLLVHQRRGRYIRHELDVTTVARLGSDFLESILR